MVQHSCDSRLFTSLSSINTYRTNLVSRMTYIKSYRTFYNNNEIIGLYLLKNKFSFRLVCKKYIRNGTTGDSSGLAFVTCFMSYVSKKTKLSNVCQY